MQKLIGLCKRRGFVYPASEIYGGLASAYDYGPLGVQLLRNIKNLWWKEMIEKRDDMVGLDSQIILHAKTWEASGHVMGFNDPMVEDKVTHKRYRADHLIENFIKEFKKDEKVVVEDMTIDEMSSFITSNKILSPVGNEITLPKAFNQLMETHLGVIEGDKDTVYLRGETAQGIFTNFKNVLDSTRITLPFGIGQLGKSFRNEITQGQFVFRTFEFEQGEIEYFFDPELSNWEDLYNGWKEYMWNFVTKTLKIKEESLRWRRHTDKERSFYSKDTYDLEYNFPFGFKELWGIAYRTNYDLNQHIKYSGVKLEYVDPKTNKKIVPHVIEPAVGINRLFFMVLNDAYVEDEKHVYLNLPARLAPYKVAVFPLVANKEDIMVRSKEVYSSLKKNYNAYFDSRGNIGKRYMYQDEIGTPFCVTIDYDTLENNTVTVRNRNTMEQERVELERLGDWIDSKLKDV
ncbi:glycine--tRNA ligase [candidate division WWE3 bacterium CG10_big_fil_rev_8_21_14_0_10_32_10]|uniref:glycine--tRNA ligase n=1 Tax=candidate division WWE3 bacterium CG10_big_fil_rev_8_21_14_0_10_32_10 TaxID=1975090 RepID=A0A2H0R912_UNCKA|nr:MAG: glycine--tRNA ligase [candidate division WWE3 bacterium CG10_big_fil_rev_8_21_14_0_10_32_10]